MCMRSNAFSGLQLVRIIEGPDKRGPDNRGCTVQTNLNGLFSHSWPHDIVRYVPKVSFLLDAFTHGSAHLCCLGMISPVQLPFLRYHHSQRMNAEMLH